MTDTAPLYVAPLRLRLRSRGLAFQGFSGSLWHGGLGMMLHRHFRPTFDLLYGEGSGSRLYALLPPPSESLPAETIFDLRLTLVGPATNHILACTQAIAQLGDTGLGLAGRYQLDSAAVVTPEGDSTYFRRTDGLLAPPRAHDIHAYRHRTGEPARFRVQLETPLRIKEGNDLLRTPPSYAQLIHRLIGRLDQLGHATGAGIPLGKLARRPLLEEAQQVRLKRADVAWTGLSRRSARTRQSMSFEGLVGELEFEGDAAQTLPWLRAGRWLQIGGKVAFGFGGYAVGLPN